MPKRMLDDSFLTSPSMARCSPRAQDAFPRFILLADDFGCFEAFPRVLLAKAWPYRQDVSEDDIWGWLEEYVAAGMACLWADATERRWCYLTGWNGPHGQRRRAEYDPDAPRGTPGAHGSKRRTPPPPPDLVAGVLAGVRRDADGKPPGTEHLPPGRPESGIANETAPARGNESASGRERREIRGSAAPDAAADAVPVPVADAVGESRGAGSAAFSAFRAQVAALLGLAPTMLKTAARGRAPEIVAAITAEVERLGLPRALEVASEAIAAAGPGGVGSLAYFPGWLQVAGGQPGPKLAPPTASDCPEWDTVLRALEEQLRADGRGDATGTVARLFGHLKAERVDGTIRLRGEGNGLAEEYLPAVNVVSQRTVGLAVEMVEGQ